MAKGSSAGCCYGETELEATGGGGQSEHSHTLPLISYLTDLDLQCSRSLARVPSADGYTEMLGCFEITIPKEGGDTVRSGGAGMERVGWVVESLNMQRVERVGWIMYSK